MRIAAGVKEIVDIENNGVVKLRNIGDKINVELETYIVYMMDPARGV